MSEKNMKTETDKESVQGAVPQSADAQQVVQAMMAAGYGNHGASKTKNALLGWIIGGGAPEDDIDLHGATLRQRSRDADMGGGIARAASATETITTIGAGLKPKPSVDWETLGITEEAAAEFERAAKREFAFWAEGKHCDAARRKNFYQLQALAFRSFFVSGDVIALLPMIEEAGSPYQIHIQLLEADRLATPDSGGESEAKEADPKGGRIIDGVEIDERSDMIKGDFNVDFKITQSIIARSITARVSRTDEGLKTLFMEE